MSNRVALTLGMRGLASPSLEMPSAPAPCVGGTRDVEDFGEVEDFATAEPVGVDRRVTGF
jgi:hypothetical protein